VKRREARLEANRELERKLEDLEERYALNVELLYTGQWFSSPTVYIYCNAEKSQTDSNSGLESLYKNY